MSERGSFATEYCYCDKCFEVLKKYLLDDKKYLCSVQIPYPSDCLNEKNEKLPIIAGKLGGAYPGEEDIAWWFE